MILSDVGGLVVPPMPRARPMVPLAEERYPFGLAAVEGAKGKASATEACPACGCKPDTGDEVGDIVDC